MKAFPHIAGMLGLALLTALIAYWGFGSVLQVIVSSKWATLLVVVARIVALTGAGIGWWLLTGAKERGPYIFIALRFVRDAINSLLPFAGIGGDAIGAALLCRFGIAGSVALASVLIDLFVQFACLLILVGAALTVVLDLYGTNTVVTAAFVMLVLALPAVTGFFLVLRFGALELLAQWLIKLGYKRRWAAFGRAAELDGSLQQIWQSRRGLLGGFAVHLASVFFGAAEVWIALAFMGHAVNPMEALAIEGLGQGSRGAAFIIPGGLGVQDSALIAVGLTFGLPAEVMLAMALIKRVPELVLGVPGLLAWQGLEGWRLLSRRR